MKSKYIKKIKAILFILPLILPVRVFADIINTPREGFSVHRDYYFFEEDKKSTINGPLATYNYTYFTEGGHEIDGYPVCISKNGGTYFNSYENKCDKIISVDEFYCKKNGIRDYGTESKIRINDSKLGTYAKAKYYSYKAGNIVTTYYTHGAWVGCSDAACTTSTPHNSDDNADGYREGVETPAASEIKSTDIICENINEVVNDDDYTITETNITTTGNKMQIERKIDWTYFMNASRTSSGWGCDPASGCTSFAGGYMPALYYREWTEECEEEPKQKTLDCEHPETLFELGTPNNPNNCNQYVTVSSGGDTALISFSQKGALKVNLNGRYIKSGESFTFGITYEDTIFWNSMDGNISNNNIKSQLKNYIKSAELFTKLKDQSRVIYEYSSAFPSSGYQLSGEWTYYVNYGGSWKKTTDLPYGLASSSPGEAVANVLFQNNNSGSVEIKVVYELVDAWANVNEEGSIMLNGVERAPYAGVYRKYTNEVQDSTLWMNEGKRFYTRLDTDTSYKNIHADIKGLSAINYKQNDTIFWQATYDCGITCKQEFYGNDSLISGSNEGYKLSYREINHKEPFPILSGDSYLNIKDKYIGLDENWITWANAIGNEESPETGTIEAQEYGLSVISERLAATYNKEPEYVVTIDRDNINNIKTYNKDNNYVSSSGYSNNRYSIFLGSVIGTRTSIYGTITRNNSLTLNDVGTCGPNRGENIKTGSCFCVLVDESGNCIYNRNFELGDDTP